MERSTYLTVAFATFGLIVATFVVRGTSRLVLGDQVAMWLSLPFALLSAGLIIGLIVVAILDRTGIRVLVDDLPD